eukprot:CAMPEP_0185598134 /NCGR_PEP_ID=MMETSP0434-20130131/81812_1 /TAXON_ID=626734 ORGANISM="Favella taraikaensis, Strain Fe Narragansett Bay" /NCGR_SAMPLE_ID=MMETSP0434 /ASSEMBLY_ACC=CAM_ASM_000379 /LENGTH=122 /DNA_ID=CAMNT_0028227053 /DNA_START=1166 /DNA_END=1534 /DNA_ORIENTATION=-
MNFKFKAMEVGDKNRDLLIEAEGRDFRLLEGESAAAIYRYVVARRIEEEQDRSVAQALSLKHQVVCPETALVGVMKIPDKITGELVHKNIRFGAAETREQIMAMRREVRQMFTTEVIRETSA